VSNFTVAGAKAFFAGNVQRRVWEAYSAEDKTAALVHAERLLRRAAGRALSTTPSAEGDAPRDDLAVYEQALYLLRNGPNPTDGMMPGFVAMDQANPERPREQDTGAICPEALRWLSVPEVNGSPAPRVELLRG
jgi:hypothetical protein